MREGVLKTSQEFSPSQSNRFFVQCTCRTTNKYHSKACPSFISPKKQFLDRIAPTEMTLEDLDWIDNELKVRKGTAI